MSSKKTLEYEFNEIVKNFNTTNTNRSEVSKSEIDFYLDNSDILYNYFDNDVQNKAELREKFLKKTDPNYIQQNDKIVDKANITHDDEYCQKCNVYRNLEIGLSKYICTKCGSEVDYINEHERLNYDNNIHDKTNFEYDPLTHFKEHLTNFQAKESTVIPSEIYDIILVEMKKEQKRNLAELDYETVKRYLQNNSDLKFTKYYSNIYRIIYNLNKQLPPNMDQQIVDILIAMFEQTIPLFEKYKKISNRKNHISYPFVIHKMLQILELDQYAVYFSPLKSKDKRNENDQIWKLICRDLKWKFYPSI